jgi:hypothetical protein
MENAMPKLSRRSLVASAASLPALAVPAVAVAATSAEPDPIFAAINRWKEACADEAAGCKALCAAEEAFRDRHGSLLPSGMPREMGEILNEKGERNPYWAFRTHEQITAMKSDANVRKLVPSFHRLLNAQTADYEENVAPLQGASTGATSARIDAAYAVFDTVPTTLAGMRAKIDFAMSVDHVTDLLSAQDEGERGTLGDFLETLYESARLIAQA